jgi:ADP-ribose pyrophosphatase YjhB (NUDIX family)
MSRFWINVEAVVWRNGTFLVIERGPGESYGAGWLAFPGGKVDWNAPEPDALERTATRELEEEVGLRNDGPWHYVESKTFGLEEPVLDVVMIARGDTGEPVVASPEEVAAVAWMTASEIRDDPRTQPWTLVTLDYLEAFIARSGWKS